MNSLYINPHLIEKNYMSISTGTGNSNYNVNTAWERYKINLSETNMKQGSRLTHVDNSVLIGKGVSVIKVSGACLYRGFANTTVAGVRIKRDGGYPLMKEFYCRPQNATTFLSHIIPSAVFEVEEGDLVEMYIRVAETGTAEVGGGLQTYLKVEVI